MEQASSALFCRALNVIFEDGGSKLTCFQLIDEILNDFDKPFRVGCK
jgi:hypothetical protein